MAKIFSKVSVSFIMLVLAFLAATPVAQAHTVTTSPQSSCRQLVVYLHGNNPATTTCLTTTTTSPHTITPHTSKVDCGNRDAMVIWSDAGLKGWSICFIGTGFVNMTSYSVNPFWNWNDQASSFATGCLAGTFYTNTNGWGQSQPFSAKTSGNFDNLSGHIPNDTLSSISITGDYSPNC